MPAWQRTAQRAARRPATRNLSKANTPATGIRIVEASKLPPTCFRGDDITLGRTVNPPRREHDQPYAHETPEAFCCCRNRDVRFRRPAARGGGGASRGEPARDGRLGSQRREPA